MRDREEKRFLCAGAVRERRGLFSRPDAVRIRRWMRRMLKAFKTGVQGAVFPAQRWSGFCVYKKRGVW